MKKAASVLLIAASLGLACCSSEPPSREEQAAPTPRRLRFCGRGVIPARAGGSRPAPLEELSGEALAIDDLTALSTELVPATRAFARTQLVRALETGRAQVVVRDDDFVYWSVAPHLAPSLLRLHAATRQALAALGGEDGERAFERARANGDPDAIAAALARFPFDPAALAAARLRAELLLESGRLDEAVMACEDVETMTDADDEAGLMRARRAVDQARALESAALADAVHEGDPTQTVIGEANLVGQTRGLGIVQGVVYAAREQPAPELGFVGLAERRLSLTAYSSPGAVRWEIVFPARVAGVKALVHGGRVHVVASTSVVALDALTGRTVWAHACVRGVSSEPVLSVSPDGTELVLKNGGAANPAEVLDLRTGRQLR